MALQARPNGAESSYSNCTVSRKYSACESKTKHLQSAYESYQALEINDKSVRNPSQIEWKGAESESGLGNTLPVRWAGSPCLLTLLGPNPKTAAGFSRAV